MIIENHGISYETTRALKQELTFAYASNQFAIRNLQFSEKQYMTLGLYDEDGLFNNLALLLSDQCPHIVKAAVFLDDDKIQFKHRQEFGGSLLKQLDDVYQYMEIQNNVRTTYEGLRRVDQFEYDNSALREALVNAIVHRDYSVGGSIFVNHYKSSVEFVSLGSLPNGIGYDDVMEGVSKPRNDKLSQIFYRLELIEAFGTGIRKIISAYRESIKQPEIKVTSNAFIVRLPKLFEDNQITVKEAAPTYNIDENDLESKTTIPVNTFDMISVQQDILRQLEMIGYINRKSVQELYGFSQTKSGVVLREMEEKGLIVKKGKGKNTHYKIN